MWNIQPRIRAVTEKPQLFKISILSIWGKRIMATGRIYCFLETARSRWFQVSLTTRHWLMDLVTRVLMGGTINTSQSMQIWFTKVCEVGTRVYQGVEDDEVAGQAVDWHMSATITGWNCKISCALNDGDCAIWERERYVCGPRLRMGGVLTCPKEGDSWSPSASIW